MKDGLPLLLVYRMKTRCRQYPFDSVAAFHTWSRRLPYRFELIRVQVIGPDHRLHADSGYVEAASAVMFCGTVAAATAIESRLDAEMSALLSVGETEEPPHNVAGDSPAGSAP